MLNSICVCGIIFIMGGNDLLVIIDGVIFDIVMLFIIYFVDIESFIILKNVIEMVMYGFCGVLGVIEIKIKKGMG